jgi:class 3 adenylate cyclase
VESEWSRSFDSPDAVIQDPLVVEEVVRLANATVGRYTIDPGWRWSTHVKARTRTELCEARHVGVSLGGRLRVRLANSTEYSIEPGQVFVIPPGHDIWVEGDKPAETIEWAGALAWHPGPEGLGDRLLATLLMSDIVESTATAERLGDTRWRALLRAHDETTAEVVNRFHGRVVKGTGDGVLALFQSARNAVLAGVVVGSEIKPLGVEVRIGIHTGEVDVTADDIHGLPVHELARITDIAQANEILVSGTTVALAGELTATFEPRGKHQLRGLSGSHTLYSATRDPRT